MPLAGGRDLQSAIRQGGLYKHPSPKVMWPVWIQDPILGLGENTGNS